MEAGTTVRPGRRDEVAELARLMVEGLNSRLNDLGPWLNIQLHRHFVESEHALCLVVEREGRIAGYGVTLLDRSAFYRQFLVRHGVKAAFMVMPYLLRPKNIRTALSGLFYSNRAPTDDPPSELVILVVAPFARRTGVGSVIIRGFIDGLRDRGIPLLKVTTPPDNEPANAFYRQHGFEYVRTDAFYHDTQVNVYVYRTRPGSEK